MLCGLCDLGCFSGLSGIWWFNWLGFLGCFIWPLVVGFQCFNVNIYKCWSKGFKNCGRFILSMLSPYFVIPFRKLITLNCRATLNNKWVSPAVPVLLYLVLAKPKTRINVSPSSRFYQCSSDWDNLWKDPSSICVMRIRQREVRGGYHTYMRIGQSAKCTHVWGFMNIFHKVLEMCLKLVGFLFVLFASALP